MIVIAVLHSVHDSLRGKKIIEKRIYTNFYVDIEENPFSLSRSCFTKQLVGTIMVH